MTAPGIVLREALARLSYENGTTRLADLDLAGADWLTTTHRGIFAISGPAIKLVAHGWFFGICRYERHLFVFENCGQRYLDSDLGRVIRFDLIDKMLGNPRILITGLHNNCHQLAVIDGLLCVVDTGNQAIRRYTIDGDVVDVRYPIPVAPATDKSGAYAHINTIAKVDHRIGLILHNGKAFPTKRSEILWLDDEWRIDGRESLPGHRCHDIVEDEQGRLWHSMSAEGDILRSDGLRIHVTSDEMTRGIALSADRMAIGISTFGPRHIRGTLTGSIVTLRRADFSRLHKIELPAAPSDIIAV